MAFMLWANNSNAQTPAPGSMVFTVTTLPNDGNFSPKHVLAIWIEDVEGNFIKTLELDADKRIQYLYTWNASSSGNVIDAETGATLSSHQTHEATWDGTGTDGELVPDGDYKVIIEYTSAHEQGPLASFTFNKDGELVSLEPSDETYFQDISIVYVPLDNTGIAKETIDGKSFKIYPNPFTENLNIQFTAEKEHEVKISIYNLKMQELYKVYEGRTISGTNRFVWQDEAGNLPSGSYYLVIDSGNAILVKNVVKIK